MGDHLQLVDWYCSGLKLVSFCNISFPNYVFRFCSISFTNYVCPTLMETYPTEQSYNIILWLLTSLIFSSSTSRDSRDLKMAQRMLSRASSPNKFAESVKTDSGMTRLAKVKWKDMDKKSLGIIYNISDKHRPKVQPSIFHSLLYWVSFCLWYIPNTSKHGRN